MDLIYWIILVIIAILVIVYAVFRVVNRNEESNKKVVAKKGGRGTHYYPTEKGSSISKEVEVDGISKAESMKRKVF